MNKQILRNIVFGGLFIVPFVPFLVFGSFFFPFITSKAFAWRVVIEIVFVAWLVLAYVDVSFRPKRSNILYAILIFLGIVGLADLLGVAPLKSFWSNFERMEGFLALIHFGMFFIVISSVFKEADWKRWWNTSLVASFIMVLYCLLQILGLKTINQGGVRVDGTLGNAIYLAVYMLFHIFIATLFLWREWKNTALRWAYAILILAQFSILYLTATRGAMLGLLGGLLVIAVLNIWNKENPLARKMGIALVSILIVVIGTFFLARNTAFVTNSPVLSRFSSLGAELSKKTQGRYFVWPIAIEGIKDRPILGWGQENFNYVFQEYYSPEMYNIEPWFDRAHNIFLDWAVAGGILGLISYLALYIVLVMAIWKSTLSFAEKSVLFGLIAAYFFHNLFVFDHLISYTLFFSLLAYIHSMGEGKQLFGAATSENKERNIYVPITIVVIVMLPLMYYFNFRPMSLGINLINALQSAQTAETHGAAANYFKRAYASSRLGRPEVVEQIATNAATILGGSISMEEKNAFYNFSKDAVVNQAKELDGDSRYQLIAGSFLSITGSLDEALTYLEKARELIPGKQQVYFEIGALYINKNETAKAFEVFKTAYEMAPDYGEAKAIYLIGAIFTGNTSVENDVRSKIDPRTVAFDDRIMNAYYLVGRVAEVREIIMTRIELDPANKATYEGYLEELAN